MSGKGDKPRPVNKQKYDENFNSIFGPRVPWWKRQKKLLTDKKDPLSSKHEDERNKKR
tara:strand:- start:340 stop:513 length:174 start_codon:yes stop_codon:yes gene_type:complete